MADPNRICMGCMRETAGEAVCPYCGFSAEEYERERKSRFLPAGTVLNGKYLVGKVIGDGGFGITYLAYDLNLQLPLAIKEYFPDGLVTRNTVTGGTDVTTLAGEENGQYFAYGLQSFTTEARNLAKFYGLDGIVSVTNFFFENMTGYLVMEYISGKTLKEYLKERGAVLTEQETLKLMHPVLKALAKIHRSGIIHRDISPDNIMMADNGKIYLIDFGAARMAVDAEKKGLTVLLKPGFAPVEQYQSRGKQGPWTDVYAVCATMYRMMSGNIPDSSTDRMINDKVMPLNAPVQARQGIHVSDRTAAAIQKGLAVRLEDRYQTVEELMKALYGEEPAPIIDPPRPIDPPGPIKDPPGPDDDSVGKKALIIMGAAVLALAVIAAVLVAVRLFVLPIINPEPEPEPEPTPTVTVTEAPTETPEPEPQMRLMSAEEPDISANPAVNVTSATASSTIQQTNGVSNYPMLLFDGDLSTSWQEGVDGSGIGESVYAGFDREYTVNYLTFHLGNWKSDNYYNGNNRPKTLRLQLGGYVFDMTFPESREEFRVAVEPGVKCNGMTLQIADVYRGTSWDDTCIAEVKIYGE